MGISSATCLAYASSAFAVFLALPKEQLTRLVQAHLVGVADLSAEQIKHWSGGDLLSHVLRRSTIGATGLNG